MEYYPVSTVCVQCGEMHEEKVYLLGGEIKKLNGYPAAHTPCRKCCEVSAALLADPESAVGQIWFTCNCCKNVGVIPREAQAAKEFRAIHSFDENSTIGIVTNTCARCHLSDE
jgi:hypothetical protein